MIELNNIKNDILDMVMDRQIEFDGYGDTETALEIAKFRIELNNFIDMYIEECNN